MKVGTKHIVCHADDLSGQPLTAEFDDRDDAIAFINSIGAKCTMVTIEAPLPCWNKPLKGRPSPSRWGT